MAGFTQAKDVTRHPWYHEAGIEFVAWYEDLLKQGETAESLPFACAFMMGYIEGKKTDVYDDGAME